MPSTDTITPQNLSPAAMGKNLYQNLPPLPGVYLMKDSAGTILYVGKARNLRKRVSSYFRPAADSRQQVPFLLARVATLDYLVTDTEKEALILENTLIKKHRPRYNINLRDDKTFFSLRLDPQQEFPALTIVRKVPADNARYFGPYSSASAARSVLKEIGRIFPLRRHPLATCRRRKRPCLFYQLRQCSGPCHGKITADEYQLLVEATLLFLEGKNHAVLALFKNKMARAAKQERYEEAARLRDLIAAIEITLERQNVVSFGGDCDVLGFFQTDPIMTVVILHIRRGILTGHDTHTFTWRMSAGEGLSSFLREYYSRDMCLPDEILVPLPLTEERAFAELLSEKKGKRVAVITPHRGRKTELIGLAMKNAETIAQEHRASHDTPTTTIAELQRLLHLTCLPRRIECYDISNLQGTAAVGSKVSFLDGRPDKPQYRHYQIKTVAGPDDYAMLHEVLSRRFDQEPAADPLPDLIVIDGGRGQLNVLTSVLAELGLTEVETAALAKSRVKQAPEGQSLERSSERIFLPGRKNPLVLRQNAPPLLLLARIRDEAHRFAITYHKKLRSKRLVKSALTEVPGVGPELGRRLLRSFGSIKNLQEATVADIAEVRGIGRTLAETIWRFLHECP